MNWKQKLSNLLLSSLIWTAGSVAWAQEPLSDSALVAQDIVKAEVFKDSSVSEILLRERLAKLENIIPLRYHAVTHQFVDFFTYRRASFTKRMLEQHPMFFPLYEQKLKEYGLPEELKYLSLIESGLNPRIISYAGAAGLWQFMPATGREYGMRQDDYFDERFDPVKSTDAACRYLGRLYRAFGDWEMALAAYNVGPGNVRRAMRRSGSSTFWGIYNFLPRQTRHYVPQFVAMLYMMHYYKDHGIEAEKPDFPMAADTVQITGYFNLHTFSKLSGVSFDELYKLNPQLINTELPAYVNKYVLHVPNHHYQYLTENRKMIWDSAAKLPYVAPAVLLANQESAANDSDSAKLLIKKVGGLVAAGEDTEDPEAIISRKPQKLFYVVRKGDNLARIATIYNVDIYDIKRWNNLNNNKIQRGKKLIIYKEAKGKIPNKETTRVAKVAPKDNKLKYYRVQAGDTLSTIAERYGLGVSQLKKLNRLKTNMVRKGQKLIIG